MRKIHKIIIIVLRLYAMNIHLIFLGNDLSLDADEGDNGKIIYSLGGADSSTFQIDRVSGRITTRDKLDYETKKSYNFNVIATDRGINPNTGTTTVTVNVIDVNDQRPVFIGSPYSAQVLENSPFGTRVKTIKATDSDSGRVYLLDNIMLISFLNSREECFWKSTLQYDFRTSSGYASKLSVCTVLGVLLTDLPIH